MSSLVILVSAAVILSCGQTDGLSESHTHTHTDAAKCLTPATVVSVSNNVFVKCHRQRERDSTKALVMAHVD